MSRKTYSWRYEAALYEGLKSLSALTDRSMNELVTEAVRLFVRRESAEVADDLEATAAKLRAYSQTDPDFERAISAFADSEGRHADPAEGRAVRDAPAAQRKLRELLADG